MRPALLLLLLALPLRAEEPPSEPPPAAAAADWDALIRSGDLAAARTALEEAVAKDGGDSERLVRLAYVCYLQGETVRARTILERVLEGAADDVAALLMLADILYRNREWAAARELYLRLEALNPDLRTVNIRLYELFRYEDRERAHRYYLRSLQLPPTDIAELLGLPASRRGRPGTDWSPAEPQEGQETNALVRYILEGGPPEVTSATELVVVARSRHGPGGGLRILRPAKPEKVVARLLGSGLIMAVYGLVRLAAARRSGSDGVVFSTYRSKTERRRP